MDVEFMNVDKMWFYKIGTFMTDEKVCQERVNIFIYMHILHDVLANSIISSYAQPSPLSLFNSVALMS